MVSEKKPMFAAFLMTRLTITMVTSMLVTATRGVHPFKISPRSRIAPVPVPVPSRYFASVSGIIYKSSDQDPTIRLFTKEGCTLCDTVKGTLQSLRDELPHSLLAVDITDSTEWNEKYKYDIPVLHVEHQYWTKHRLSLEEAREGLIEARAGNFKARQGEPDAGKMEHRQEKRRK